MRQLIKIETADALLDSLLKPFSSIGQDWMLITAGSGTARGDWNTMTASWGSLGVIWAKKTITCVIRPTRHTYRFAEREEILTFSFFPPSMKKALSICGSTSGADTDKAEEASLTPVLLESGAVGFAEASLTLVGRKLYSQDIEPECFLDKELDSNYPLKDYHRMYICEITRVYQGEK